MERRQTVYKPILILIYTSSLLVGLITLSLPSVATAETPGEVAGTVRGLDVEVTKDGAVAYISGVKVSLREMNSSRVRTTETNSQGEYRFSDVAPGEYQLTAERRGFQFDKPVVITVVAGKTTTRPIDLYEAVEDKPGLPRVLIIGDSISIGYTPHLRKLLRGKANVHRIPDAVGTVVLLPNLKRWLGSGRWDVIQFNCGLHDILRTNPGVYVTPAEYEKNLRKIVEVLKTTRAKPVWASTTPVPPEGTKGRRNEDVIAYNAIAKRIMVEENIPIDDLYSYAFPRLKQIQRPANVHYRVAGYKFLAEKVASVIEQQLTAEKQSANSKHGIAQ